MEYEAVIGLEVHVQVRTKSKMFCSCANVYGAEPNTLVCPVCLGYPGALPVPNHEAIRAAVRAGLLTGCEIARYSKFDRKILLNCQRPSIMLSVTVRIMIDP